MVTIKVHTSTAFMQIRLHAIYKPYMKKHMQSIGIGWSTIQLPCVLFTCTTWPSPITTLYSVGLHNGTAKLHAETVELYPAYIGTSLAIAVFAMISMQMQQNNTFDNMTDFSTNMVESFATWNLTFWVIFVFTHTLLITQVTSPVDLYCILFLTIGQYMTLSFLCKPRELYRGYENIALIAYFGLCMIVFYEMHTHHGLKTFVLCLSMVSDLLLVTGHTYDPSVNTETIGNCRTFHVSMNAVLLLFLFFAV